jgi:hypothetical protein
MSQSDSFVLVPPRPGRSDFVPPPRNTFYVEARLVRFFNPVAGFRFGFFGFIQLALGSFGLSSAVS